MSARSRGIAPLAAAYVAFGVFWGCLAVTILDLLDANDLSPGRVGLYFTATSLTGIATMTLLAPRLEHLPRRLTIPLALMIEAAGAFLLGTLHGNALPVAFVVVGVGTGLIDVLINAVGHEFEGRSGAPVLQWVHSMYGVGAAAGALAGGIGLTVGLDYQQVLAGAALAQVVAAVVCALSPVLRATPVRARSETKVSLSVFLRWPFLLVPALIVASAFFVEGSMDVWAGMYLRSTLRATAMAGAIGVAAFGIATAGGRAFAARILFGLGYRRTILLGGIGACLAGGAAVLAPTTAVASIAFLVMGFCLSSAAPAAFGSVEGTGDQAGIAIAAVTTVGYSGFIIGPPVMGWLAEATGSFRVTMVVITVAALGVVAGGLLSHDRIPRPENEAKA